MKFKLYERTWVPGNIKNNKPDIKYYDTPIKNLDSDYLLVVGHIPMKVKLFSDLFEESPYTVGADLCYFALLFDKKGVLVDYVFNSLYYMTPGYDQYHHMCVLRDSIPDKTYLQQSDIFTNLLKSLGKGATIDFHINQFIPICKYSLNSGGQSRKLGYGDLSREHDIISYGGLDQVAQEYAKSLLNRGYKKSYEGMTTIDIEGCSTVGLLINQVRGKLS